MKSQLTVSIGQQTDKGRKALNQDFHGVTIPGYPLLSSKGIVIALADGISSSQVSQIASETAVKSFLEDYYCTSESWSVKTAAQKVLFATNSWLYNQTRKSQYRYDKNKGYVCTFSALILKSTTAHVFHAGDSRVYRLQRHQLEQLTEDHRMWGSKEKSYLSRALGINEQLEIDYQKLPLEEGDIFLLATDGIYEFVTDKFMVETIDGNLKNLDHAAKLILDEAYQRGSADNLTLQIIKVEQLPLYSESEIHQQLTLLPFAPKLSARMEFDGYEILREVHITNRSHVYLARDIETNIQVIIKTPSVDLRDDTVYLERFLMEEWIARRIDHENVLKPCLQTRKRNFLYIVTEYIEGQTLAQWMVDHPMPDVETVRRIIEQLAKGLRAFHRQEMLHQDLRPNNIMIDQNGTVKIIDFGATRVAGLMEISTPFHRQDNLGTAQFTAPEYFLGEAGTTQSDLFSLGVITYQMLSGKLPYGTQVARSTTKSAQRNLRYQTVLDDDRSIPAWMDDAIKKAVQPMPAKRYTELSEFIQDLRRPSSAFLNKTQPPLIERNPLLFWKGVSFGLLLIIIFLLMK